MTAASSVNTSATGGYLAPTSEPPADDLDLDVQIQAIIVGVTGLPGDLVRPRWQDRSEAAGGALPRVPEAFETWCAVEIVSTTADDTPAQIHVPDGDGYTILRRFERLDVLASFYGPRGDAYAKLTRDALYVGQNREAMGRQGMSLIGTDPIRRIPAIVAMDTRRKSDLAFRLNRRVERRYEIQNVLQGVGAIQANANTTDGPVIVTTPFAAPEI